MSSHARTNRFHKSKNLRGNDEDLGGLNLTPCNPSKPQSLKTLSSQARQSCKSSLSSDRYEYQESTLHRFLMKLSVQPEKETDNEYENEADDDFRSSPQQISQPANHSLEENPLDKDKEASISDYQSGHNPSRPQSSLEKKQIDIEMLKGKNRNLEPILASTLQSHPEFQSYDYPVARL